MTAEGSPEATGNEYRVIEAYLGNGKPDAEVRAFLRPQRNPLAR